MEHIYQQPQFGEDWFTYPRLYFEMVQKFSSGSKFVEVGCWKGKSASYLAVELINSGKNIEFYCVDTWEGSIEHHEQMPDQLPSLYDTFIDNMKPLENTYIPLRMPSIEASSKFEDSSLDFVFIDASHEYQDVKDDIAAWLPKIKKGGILAGHDYMLPSVNNAVNESINVNGLIDINCWVCEIN